MIKHNKQQRAEQCQVMMQREIEVVSFEYSTIQPLCISGSQHSAHTLVPGSAFVQIYSIPQSTLIHCTPIQRNP
jgi:hypothetical protein